MYVWRKNHECRQPKNLCFLDTESYHVAAHREGPNGYHTLRLGCCHICGWNGSSETTLETFEFNDHNKFWDRLLSSCKRDSVMWVFAHNIMFDLWMLGWPEMLEAGASIITRSKTQGPPRLRELAGKHKPWKGMCSIDKGCTIIHTMTGGKRVNFVDSYNYYRCTVESLGESIGLPKLPMPSSEAPDSDWFTYCRRDVAIIREGITSLMREWKASDLGNWQATAPSLAFSSYRHRFAPRPFVCHNDAEAGRLERDAYFDGRTQPIRMGQIDGPVYHVDVNSLYPSVMKGNDYPYRAKSDVDGKPLVLHDTTHEELEYWISRASVVANVKIVTNAPYYPMRYAGRVIYPVGQFSTTLCTPELWLALSRGDVSCVNWMMMYDKCKMFDTWVDYWSGRRQHYRSAGNFAGAECCKVILNSLAGKLGQKSRHWVNNATIPVDEPWDSWIHLDEQAAQPIRCRSIGYSAQVQVDAGDSPHALVAAAAHVSSYARVHMLDVIRELPRQSVYYVGNDSLLLSADGYCRLAADGMIDESKLGCFRLCHSYQNVHIYGPRDYVADGATVKAGLPRGSRQLADRSWECELFEESDSLISRQPNMSIKTHSIVLNGSDVQPGLSTDPDGWVRWPVVHNGKIINNSVDNQSLWGYTEL